MARLILLGFVCMLVIKVQGQSEQNILYSNADDYQKINISLNSSKSFCRILSTSTENVINIKCHQTEEKYQPKYQSRTHGDIYYINVNLSEVEDDNIGTVLSSLMFDNESDKSSNYDVNLPDNKPMELNLNYAIGNADIDLSGLPVEKLKIKSGSAHVNLLYQSKSPNTRNMDTLLIKVDMGTINADNLQLANAETILVDVGFGNMTMNINESLAHKTNMNASVGAGWLEMNIEEQVPVIINLNDSPLCHVKLPKSFKKISNGVYTNELYTEYSSNPLILNLDIAMGKVIINELKAAVVNN